MNTIDELAHSERRIVNVIEPVMVPMDVQQCAVDEVITPYENTFKKNAIVNLFGAVLYNVKLVKNSLKFTSANRSLPPLSLCWILVDLWKNTYTKSAFWFSFFFLAFRFLLLFFVIIIL